MPRIHARKVHLEANIIRAAIGRMLDINCFCVRMLSTLSLSETGIFVACENFLGA